METTTNDHEDYGFDEAKYATMASGDMSFDLNDWNVKHIFKDTVFAKVIDETKESFLMRKGLYVPSNSGGKEFFRFLEVVLAGPTCSESIKPGAIIIVPHAAFTVSIAMKKQGQVLYFLKEDHVMAVVEPQSGQKE